ncbi:hypothetical protein [Luteipulveratus mongoliensis]|uniref:hypothetical protein n=1 Tax=Luteipulveratus mongoliensis TaxID=571913 RepID=UPI0012EDD94F|nr:hypothetical protein [Luteipulveratus mongoliensis]
MRQPSIGAGYVASASPDPCALRTRKTSSPTGITGASGSSWQSLAPESVIHAKTEPDMH